jgi:ribulose-phosphate 3-epimerase
MAKKIEVSASILSSDFGKLADAVKLCEDSGVDRIHVDVMDGHFVPNITIGPVITAAVRKYTKLPVAVHLMIEHPGDYIKAFAEAGADIIAVQAECYGERRAACRAYGQYPKEVDAMDGALALRDISRIKASGCQASMVMNPGTPVDVLEPVLGELSAVLVMSVNPGFSGQSFMPVALGKIEWLRARFSGDIAVDGGINSSTAPGVVKAGANVLITASYFFSSKDPRAAVTALKVLGGH